MSLIRRKTQATQKPKTELKPKPKRIQPTKLSNDQVLSIRELYFKYGSTMRELAKKHSVSKALIQQAIHSEGRFSTIKDNIPSDTKRLRLSAKGLEEIQRVDNARVDYLSGKLSKLARQEKRPQTPKQRETAARKRKSRREKEEKMIQAYKNPVPLSHYAEQDFSIKGPTHTQINAPLYDINGNRKCTSCYQYTNTRVNPYCEHCRTFTGWN